MKSIYNAKTKCAFLFKQWGTWGADGIKRNKKPMVNCLKIKNGMNTLL